MGVKAFLILFVCVVVASVVEAQNWPYASSYDGSLYPYQYGFKPNRNPNPKPSRRSSLNINKEDDEADDEVVTIPGESKLNTANVKVEGTSAAVTKTKATSSSVDVKPDSNSKVVQSPVTPTKSESPKIKNPLQVAPGSQNVGSPATSVKTKPQTQQPGVAKPEKEVEEEESDESDEEDGPDGSDGSAEGQDEFTEYEEAVDEDEEAPNKKVIKLQTPKIKEVVKVVKKTYKKKKVGDKSQNNPADAKEIIVPGYVTNYGEVLVPLDTVLREHDQQHVTIIPDNEGVKHKGVRSEPEQDDDQEDESEEEDDEIPYPLAYYVEDDFYEDSKEEEDGEAEEEVQAPPRPPLQYIPAKAPTGEDDEWDASKPKQVVKAKPKTRNQNRADLPIKKKKSSKKNIARNEMFTAFPPSRDPELFAVIKSRVPVEYGSFERPLVDMDISNLYGPQYYRPIVKRPSYNVDNDDLAYLMSKYYAQRYPNIVPENPVVNRVFIKTGQPNTFGVVRKPGSSNKYTLVQIRPFGNVGGGPVPIGNYQDVDYEPHFGDSDSVFTRPSYYRPSYSPYGYGPVGSQGYQGFQDVHSRPSPPSSYYVRRPSGPPSGPSPFGRPSGPSPFGRPSGPGPFSRPSSPYRPYSYRPSYPSYSFKPSGGPNYASSFGYGPSSTNVMYGRPTGGFSRPKPGPVQYEEGMMDKVFYSKPMKTKVKGPAPMSIAQYIAQVNRKPTPVVSMKNDNYVKNPQDVSFSNESDESQLNSSDVSDDSQGQQQQVPVMPENESEIEERMQKRQRGRRPGKNAFTSDPLNILGKIKPNRS